MTAEEKLIAERKRLYKRMEKLRETLKADQQRVMAIERALERLRLGDLVGVTGAVKPATRYEADHRYAKFNQARGTLIKVNRTRALVDFGDLGRWAWPIDELVATDGKQSVTLEALAAGDTGDAP